MNFAKAVAIGMIISEYSEKAGITEKGTTEVKSCLEKYNLPTSIDVPVSQLIGTQ